MLKNNRGITLIALVITIIVLLILAGVSIAMLTGDNGILNQATDARDDTKAAEIREKVEMAVQAAYAAQLAANPTSTAELQPTAVAGQYDSDNGTTGTTFNSVASSDPAAWTATIDGYTVTLTRSNKTFTVTAEKAST